MKKNKPKTKDRRPKTNDVAAILLAAGRSRRMGAFKPLLPFGQTTVIRSCIQNLQAAGVEDIVVVLGHRAGDVTESLKDLDLRFALNPDPESEMSDSIRYGVRELPTEAKAILIALTDHPAVPPDAIRTIVQEWRSGQQLVIPEFQSRGGHPVLVDLRFRDELMKLDSNRGLKSLFDAHKAQVRRLPANSPYIARDMDTWDDYRALHEEIFGTQPNMGH
ncbi:MAG TPA: nucleotidyltransferase family protein [Pyrinomonadaceae bacterium]|nr:nucleotidyltransferase family protein [Pyrinomonadaceae bacterium]